MLWYTTLVHFLIGITVINAKASNRQDYVDRSTDGFDFDATCENAGDDVRALQVCIENTVSATATSVSTTATSVSSTATSVSATATSVSSTTTSVSATPTSVSPTPTSVSATTTATVTVQSCGVRIPAGNSGQRIVGGQPADVREWPWMVSVQSKTGFGHICGGTLISSRYVLSAAHCFDDLTASSYSVILGEYNLNEETSGTVAIEVELMTVYNHLAYNDDTYVNDIAVLTLARDVNFTADVAPICLPPAGDLYVDKVATIIGWGKTNFNDLTGNPVLLEAEVPIWSNSNCSQSVSGTVTDDMVCAGLREGGKDSCQGDSGGPMMLQDSQGRWMLVGIVSWGNGCAAPNSPGVYTRVSNYLQWIDQNTPKLPSVTTPTSVTTVTSSVATVASSVTQSSSISPSQTSTTQIATATASNCGARISPTRSPQRIVGGQPADVREWPWMVSVQSIGFGHICGGTLISSQHVLSATHCFDLVPASSLSVKLGEYDLNDFWSDTATIEVGVKSIQNNVDYSSSTLVNDITVLTLEREVAFSADVAPICLPPAGDSFVDKTATITGWGKTNFNDVSGNSILLEAEVPIWNNTECKNALAAVNPVTENMICAGLREGGKDTCQGDSGGPMMLQDSQGRWMLVGVTSWGSGCGNANSPGVYTRVSEYLQWISQNMIN